MSEVKNKKMFISICDPQKLGQAEMCGSHENEKGVLMIDGM